MKACVKAYLVYLHGGRNLFRHAYMHVHEGLVLRHFLIVGAQITLTSKCQLTLAMA